MVRQLIMMINFPSFLQQINSYRSPREKKIENEVNMTDDELKL